MRDFRDLDQYRVPLMGDYGDQRNGAFRMKIMGQNYSIMVSDGGGWEHVSVSHHKKVPSWDVMCKVKDLFFEEDETVMQLHPKKSEYINNHPNCLHLWKPVQGEIPVPPSWMVGFNE